MLSYRDSYAKEFNAMYHEIGRKYDVPVMPFILRNIVCESKYWVRNGGHPNLEGQKIMARDVLEYLNPVWQYR